MSLTLYFHPLSSFCQKALIALYENDTPFTPHLVDLMDPKANADFKAIWPIGKFPVLRDERERTDSFRNPASSSSIWTSIIPERPRFIPKDADAGARDAPARPPVRPLSEPADAEGRHRQAAARRARTIRYGVEEAKSADHTSLRMLDELMAKRPGSWATMFTMADCAAAPPLFYIDMVMPLGDTYKNVAAYLKRLKERPSYARALKEAEPYFKMMPQ